jgi:DNA-binding NtrC family response regulator
MSAWRDECSSHFSRLAWREPASAWRPYVKSFVIMMEPLTSRANPVAPLVLPLGSGETVLIVENERERLTRDEEELAALGYEPIGFESSVDALEACRSQPGRFDIILVSLGSQTQNGLDLARALHKIVPHRPVLLAAASSIEVNVNGLAETGISEVLRWPLVSSELAAALARCMQPPTTLRS